MSVTVCSVDDYVIEIDAAGSGSRALRIKWGSSATEVWSMDQNFVVTVTDVVNADGPLELNSRVTSGNALEFQDSASTVRVALDYQGGWICGAPGIILKTLSTCPSGGAADGTTYTMSTSAPVYALVGRVSGNWRKVSLT